MCKLTLDWLERLLDLRILREVPVPGEFKYHVDGFFTVPPAAASLPHELFAHILPNQRVAVEVDGCVCVCVCVCLCVCHAAVAFRFFTAAAKAALRRLQ